MWTLKICGPGLITQEDLSYEGLSAGTPGATLTLREPSSNDHPI